MKVRIRDDEGTEDVGTWTVSFAVRVPSRRKREDDRKAEAPDEKDNGGEERER